MYLRPGPNEKKLGEAPPVHAPWPSKLGDVTWTTKTPGCLWRCLRDLRGGYGPTWTYLVYLGYCLISILEHGFVEKNTDYPQNSQFTWEKWGFNVPYFWSNPSGITNTNLKITRTFEQPEMIEVNTIHHNQRHPGRTVRSFESFGDLHIPTSHDM